MELRLLTTPADRKIFREAMRAIRATRGGGFRDLEFAKTSEIQLSFARLYGLYDEELAPDRLLGGFSLHALNEFSQSFPTPDLTAYPQESVFEAGQLWAVNSDSAIALRRANILTVALLQASALLIYPVVIPIDISKLYRAFRRVGPPFRLPFATTVKGEDIWLQPMLLEGAALRDHITRALSEPFSCSSGGSLIRFAKIAGGTPAAIAGAGAPVQGVSQPDANPQSNLSSNGEKPELLGDSSTLSHDRRSFH